MRKYNAPRRSSGERIKLWRKSDILKCLTPPDALWGFTKVRDDEERELVLKVIREMSMAAPRLTWVLYDENGSTEGREIIIRDGKVVNGMSNEGFSQEIGSECHSTEKVGIRASKEGNLDLLKAT